MPKIVIKKSFFSYDIALICWILYSIIVGATTFPISSSLGNIWYMLCIVLLLFNFFKIKIIRKSYTMFFFTMGIIVFFAMVANTCGYPPLIAWVLLVICSSEVDRTHIVSVYLKTYLFLCILVPAMAFLGLIPNTVIDTVGTTGVRTAYGFTHPNVFAACVLVLMMCWTYLNWRRVTLVHVIIVNLIGYGLLLITDSFAGFICILFMSLLALFERLLDKRGKMKVWYNITIALLILCPIISFYLMKNYDANNPAMMAIDLLSTGRLRTMNAFYNAYGWSWFGQNLSFDLERRSRLLFALDNSYAYMLIKFGLIVTLVYFIGLGRELAIAVRYKDNFLIICIMAFILYGCFENYFFKAQFNFTLLFIASSQFKLVRSNQQQHFSNNHEHSVQL